MIEFSETTMNATMIDIFTPVSLPYSFAYLMFMDYHWDGWVSINDHAYGSFQYNELFATLPDDASGIGKLRSEFTPGEYEFPLLLDYN